EIGGELRRSSPIARARSPRSVRARRRRGRPLRCAARMSVQRKLRRRAKAWRGAKEEIQLHSVAEPGGLWIHTHGLRGAPTYLGEPAGSEAPPLPGGLPGRAGEARAAGARDRGRRLRGPQLVEAEPREPIADHYDHE